MRTTTPRPTAEPRLRALYGSAFLRGFLLCLLLLMPFPGQALCGEVTPTEAAQAERMLNDKTPLAIIDIRTPREFAAGHIPGAVNIDFNSPHFDTNLRQLAKTHGPDTPWLVYCRTGNRSTTAMPTIQTYFAGRIYHLHKGIVSWTGPLEKQ